MSVTVGVLGPVALAVEGRKIELPSGTQRALLATLALRVGRNTSPALLADVVWGDDPPPSARGTLQAHLSRLRRTLSQHGAPEAIVSSASGYVLDLPPRAVDAVAFELAVGHARQAIRSDRPDLALEVLEPALERWRDMPLADVPDGDYVEAERHRLEALHVDALELHATAILAEVGPADLSGLVADFEALVAAHPLHERFWVLLMQALHRAGRDAEAILVYDRAQATIADALGVDPGDELRELHAELLARDAERTASPAAAAPSDGQTVGHNLPTPLTSFVGREELRDELSEVLGQRRLVTLVGPGGAGKTRLALEVAHQVAGSLPGRVPDGVWFVDLTSVEDDGQVPAALANAVGVREQAGERLVDRLPKVLRSARMLIVLDNCEHVVDAVAHLVEDLLEACPGVRALATSREPLGVTGELLWDLAGLELPDPDAAGRRAGSAATELLLQRARDVRRGFVLAGGDVGLAVDVCRQLDGLPLAIEIAAAQLRDHSLEEVARLIDGRFRLTAQGSRTAPVRQRTLEGAIAWSCELLTSEERKLLGQLSVFPGSFTEDAVRAVCRIGGRDDGSRSEALEILKRLVQRSLVGSVETGAEKRYRLLETIRAYVRDHLAPDDAAELAERLHCWATRIAREAEVALQGRDQGTWLDRLDRDRDNLGAALGWAVEHGPPDAAGQVAVPLLWFWIKRGRMVEGERWLRAAVAQDTAPSDSRLRTLNAWSIALENVHGPVPELDPTLDEARRLALSLDDREGKAWNDCWAGMSSWGDLDRARTFLLEAERGFAELGQRWGRALVRMYLIFVERLRGDYDAAEEHASFAVSEFDDLGELWAGAMTRSMLAILARYRRDWDRSRSLLEQSLATGNRLGSPDVTLGASFGLAVLADLEGDLERAADILERSADLARRAGSVSLVAESLASAGLAAVRMDAIRRALGHVQEIASDPQLAGYRRAFAGALDVAARASASLGDPRRAVSLHATATAVREGLGERPRPELARLVEVWYGELRLELGDAEFERAWEAGGRRDPLEALRDGLASVAVGMHGAGGVSPPAAPARAHGGAATA